MSEPTTVATTKPALPPEIQARVEENKQRNAVVAAIRGTIWGKDLSHEQVRAVAQYARDLGLDPVRHVEVLGGRPYLTAELYDEKGASLIQAGIIQPLDPDLISDDPRLAKLAEAGDEWAREEQVRRLRLRIQHGVPDKAAAAVVTRFRVTATGAEIVGVNWCGGGVRQRDPVGDAEPVKTAIRRSRRRAWVQLVTVVPELAERVPSRADGKALEVKLLEVSPPDALPAAQPSRRLGSGTLPSDYDDTRPAFAGREPVRVVQGTPTPAPSLDALGVPEGERDPYGLEGGDA
jgi:hypothetical protein